MKGSIIRQKNGRVSVDLTRIHLMRIDPVATGRQIKKMRRTLNLTQEQLSEIFEQAYYPVSRVSISLWESGRKLPSPDHLVLLAVLFDCSLDELVFGNRRSQDREGRDQPVPLIFLCLLDEHLLMRMLVFCYSSVNGFF